MPVKIPADFCVKIDKLIYILKMYIEFKGPKTVQTTLKREKRLTLHYFKTYVKATVVLALRQINWFRNNETKQSLEIDHTFEQLFLDKGKTEIQWRKYSLSVFSTNKNSSK